MDQAFFSLKRAHHASLRFLRPLLAEYGLTPARFDFLSAVELDSMQSGVQRILGLARSTVCEMVARLEELGLISRAKFRRTYMILTTPKARELFRRALDGLVNSGLVPIEVDRALTGLRPELGDFAAREEVEAVCERFRSSFGDFACDELYPWHPDEYIGGLEFGEFVLVIPP